MGRDGSLGEPTPSKAAQPSIAPVLKRLWVELKIFSGSNGPLSVGHFSALNEMLQNTTLPPKLWTQSCFIYLTVVRTVKHAVSHGNTSSFLKCALTICNCYQAQM